MATIQIGNQDWHTRYALAKAVECQSESPFMVQWMREKIYFHKFQSVDDFEAWQEENGKNKSKQLKTNGFCVKKKKKKRREGRGKGSARGRGR